MTVVRFKDNLPSFLDEFFGGDIFNSPKSTTIGKSLPAINVKENDKNFLLEVAAPGMRKDNFKIELNNNILGIYGEKEEEDVEERKRYTRREFSYSTFKRTFTLPESIDVEKIVANYNDGVLSIEIPKKDEEEKSVLKTISIS